MLHDLSKQNSILSCFVSELRNVDVHSDRQRFRRNLERIGEVCAYEISRTLAFEQQEIRTPLGTAAHELIAAQPVLGTILRAGLALHQGLLNYFDGADNAYISAYRKHDQNGGFSIELEYLSCPTLDARVLILSDPMLATGSSMVATIEQLLKVGTPQAIHLVSAIASAPGIETVQRALPQVEIWTAAVDAELDRRGYIVPGLGDAGDLAYGPKLQR